MIHHHHQRRIKLNRITLPNYLISQWVKWVLQTGNYLLVYFILRCLWSDWKIHDSFIHFAIFPFHWLLESDDVAAPPLCCRLEDHRAELSKGKSHFGLLWTFTDTGGLTLNEMHWFLFTLYSMKYSLKFLLNFHFSNRFYDLFSTHHFAMNNWNSRGIIAPPFQITDPCILHIQF